MQSHAAVSVSLSLTELSPKQVRYLYDLVAHARSSGDVEESEVCTTLCDLRDTLQNMNLWPEPSEDLTVTGGD